MLIWLVYSFTFFFFKQKPAYEMRISDWSSDVCSSDLAVRLRAQYPHATTGGLLQQPRVVVVSTKRDAAHTLARARTDARIITLRQRRTITAYRQIGRASCRERVCQYV